ncbi:MAG: hypothetical protein AAFZ65_08845 [Planctomycetota bacterium]
MQPFVPVVGLTTLFAGLGLLAASLHTQPGPIEPEPEWVVLQGPLTDFRPVETDTPGEFFGGGPSNPTGENAEGADAFCCQFSIPPCPGDPGQYDSGDSFFLNYYWEETLPDVLDGNWVLEFDADLRLPNGTQFDVVGTDTIDFGDLSGFEGQALIFCTGFEVLVPELPEDFGTVGQGFSVSSIQGAIERTNVNSFSVN